MSTKEKVVKLEQILLEFFKTEWRQQKKFSELLNLNLKELFIIQTLGMKNVTASMTELANLFNIPSTTMTSIIDRLVKKKYLKRFRTKKDRRIVKVTLSEEGKELFNRFYDYSLESKLSLLDKLSEKEQEKLISLLSKIMKS